MAWVPALTPPLRCCVTSRLGISSPCLSFPAYKIEVVIVGLVPRPLGRCEKISERLLPWRPQRLVGRNQGAQWAWLSVQQPLRAPSSSLWAGRLSPT